MPRGFRSTGRSRAAVRTEVRWVSYYQTENTRSRANEVRFQLNKKEAGIKTLRIVLLVTGILTGAVLSSAQGPPSNDLRDALNALQPVINSVVSQCTNTSGETSLFSAATVPVTSQNPFTPQLITPGSPSPGSVGGYYQLALYLSSQGHYISRMTFPAVFITNADQLNGIDARYRVDLYAKAYRIYDTRTRRWSDWTTAGSFGNDVHYASFMLQRKHGNWEIQGGFLINTTGKLKAVNCATLPSP